MLLFLRATTIRKLAERESLSHDLKDEIDALVEELGHRLKIYEETLISCGVELPYPRSPLREPDGQGAGRGGGGETSR